MGQRGLLLRLTHAGTQLLLKSAIAAAGWHALWSCGTDLLAAPNVPVSHRFATHIIVAIAIVTLLDLVRNLGMSEHWSNYAHHALTLTVCACGLLCGGTGGTGVPRLGAMIAVFALMESVAPFYQLIAIQKVLASAGCSGCSNGSSGGGGGGSVGHGASAPDGGDGEDDMGVGSDDYGPVGALGVNLLVRTPASLCIAWLAARDMAGGCLKCGAHTLLMGCALAAPYGDYLWSSAIWRSLRPPVPHDGKQS